MTKVQKEQIYRIVGQLVDDPEDVPDKIKAIESLAKKGLGDFNAQNADEILRILKKKLAEKEAA